MRFTNRAPEACETIDIAGMGEKPATRSGPYFLIVWTCAAATISAGLVPGGADQAALAACGLVGLGPQRVLDDVLPRLDRVAVVLGLGLAEHLQQDAADVGVADPRGRVGVPGEGGAAGAAAGLVLRGVRADRRVVGLLGLPGDDPVLDVDLPRARARAVHPVGGADHLVVAPPVPVEVVGLAAPRLRQRPQVVGDRPLGEEPAAAHQRVGQRAVHPDVSCSMALPVLGRVRRTTVRVSTRVRAAVIDSIQRPIA